MSFVFVGCTGSPQKEQLSSNSEMSVNGSAVNETEGNEFGGNETVIDEQLLFDKYADIALLPILDIDLEPVRVFEDRTLKIEDGIDNGLELLAYDFYYYEMAPDFEKQMALLGENQVFQSAVKNGQKAFEEGKYYSEIVIHELDIFEPKDFDDVSDSSKEDVCDAINAFRLSEYAIVEVELTWEYNEAMEEAGPQLGEGRYKRYYLVGKTNADDEWKIYDVYWDEYFMPER